MLAVSATGTAITVRDRLVVVLATWAGSAEERIIKGFSAAITTPAVAD